MLKELRRVIVATMAMGRERHEQKDLRRLQGFAARLFGGARVDVEKGLEGIMAVAELHEREAASWIEPEVLTQGGGGAFDACDLRYWLALAERAGAPYIEAREILRLDEEEMALASGTVETQDTALTRGLRRRIDRHRDLLSSGEALPIMDEDERRRRLAKIEARTFDAMDDVPDGWMVRGNRGGSEELKALAGAGLADGEAPTAAFDPDLEVGPGWVRNGNRRRVNVSDPRTVMLAAQGRGDGIFLARPWMQAARQVVSEDPHRHGSVFAGKGVWPCEWRAFVEGGKVVGVAFYYAWAGEASEENARIALEVRDLAQRIVDVAVQQRAHPRFMDVELARGQIDEGTDPRVVSAVARFGREDVACTLDFLEVADQGLMLLEGGPPNTPFGGGHPCAFAGAGGPPRFPNATDVSGVAFGLMPGVLMVDPRTWNETDRRNCILDWNEVEALAASASPSP